MKMKDYLLNIKMNIGYRNLVKIFELLVIKEMVYGSFKNVNDKERG